MRLTAEEFILQFPDHPISSSLLKKKKTKRTPHARNTRKKSPAAPSSPKKANTATTSTEASQLEALLLLHLRAEGLTAGLEREYQFDAKRKWRMDFAWVAYKVAVEVEGGVWTQGRHTRPQGFINDTHKYNQATLQGWSVLRFAEPCIRSGDAVTLIKQMLLTKKATR